MLLPTLSDPVRYGGLYVFDFGDWSAVGYTADEVAVLLESDSHRDGRVYKIVRAWPDGRMELKGVSRAAFSRESGMFFHRADDEAAAADFEQLAEAADRSPPPGRAKLHLAERRGDGAGWVIALIYPAEYEDEFAAWLLELDYRGGDVVEGGPSRVSDYYAEGAPITQRRQLGAAGRIASRPAEEVLATVRRAVQR